MHVPFEATVAAAKAYGTPSSSTAMATLLAATQRAAVIFSGSNLDVKRQAHIDCFNGQPLLTQYQVASQTWTIVPNNMNATPLYGTSGIDNRSTITSGRWPSGITGCGLEP